MVREWDWAEPSRRGACPEVFPPCLVSGPASARELCDRRPALAYGAGPERGGAPRESAEPKSTPFLTSASAARAGFDESRPVVESHTAAMRERGREALKER